ncbi:class F sortase [Nostocoides sp. HKS02]|uniref:class F sortase n=1 Tax=Nostocoides sp. HKS02 TaxID=1813880 RepID=UPI0018A86491|nr:class F sortase [Tetrasphaera sp. HKS02]
MSGRSGQLVRRGSVVVAAVGAALVVAAALAGQGRPAPSDFGSTGALAPPPATVAPPAVVPSSAPSATVAPTAVAPAAPVRVDIPALGVRAVVLPVHAVEGVLGVPADPQQLGWWADGARVGAVTGTVAIDGHVDSAATGAGALFHLTDLRPGAVVRVTTTSGQVRSYVVTARRSFLKRQGLPPDLFRADGPPRLVLITCGGPFDATARSYLDNVVVFAVPV